MAKRSTGTPPHSAIASIPSVFQTNIQKNSNQGWVGCCVNGNAGCAWIVAQHTLLRMQPMIAIQQAVDCHIKPLKDPYYARDEVIRILVEMQGG
eukprot:4386551-Pleurochrysis_carterae.AAC.1